MIEALDTAVRLISIGASLLLLILLIAGEVRRDLKITLLGMLIGAAAYLINSSEAFRAMFPWVAFTDLASLLLPLWLWLFARFLFERAPPRNLTIAIVAVMIVCWYAGNFVPSTRPVGFYIIHFLALGLIADLMRVAWSGRSDDLIEKRRLIRLWFPVLVALQAGGVLLYETLTGGAIASPSIQLANAVLILLLTLFAGLAMLRADPVLLMETEHQPRTAQDDPATLSASEKVLSEKLAASMEEGFYRTPGLTIAKLAEHLDTPEHRLRALINQRLGYRNFSAFLNRHRVAEAREILADKARVDLPVLTIAMDLGYNSLPTFNRAFKAESGMTPTDYRREKLGGSAEQN